MIAIEARGLTKKFGNFTAVDNLNLTVEAGLAFGLLGPNGAGKTTTIRMITGLIKPTAGTVKVYGHDVSSERSKVIEKIGYMPQKFGLYEDLTVEENMVLFGRLYGLSKSDSLQRSRELMEFLDLKEFRNRLAGKLSGGTKQRLALAVALIHDPLLLILDEPTAGVDPPIRRQFWEIFRDLNRKGKTILLTTHYMDEAENCDKLALMSSGRIIAEGSPSEVKRKAFGGDIVEIVLSKPINIDLQGVKVMEAGDGRMKLLVDDYSARVSQIIARFGPDLRDIRPVHVSLEEAFIKLMRG
ncbi:MAG: ATP-binding cassette domain-containing protein [Candidatus Methanodesulfokora sp.]|jgi:ABC-2 type transport system ATP-binding protein